jgi:hypothetical protein
MSSSDEETTGLSLKQQSQQQHQQQQQPVELTNITLDDDGAVEMRPLLVPATHANEAATMVAHLHDKWWLRRDLLAALERKSNLLIVSSDNRPPCLHCS